jgi:heptosyltransferase-2
VREPRRIEPPPGGYSAIAVIRLSSLGDVILALPVVHALARAFPSARLTFWTKEEYRDVVRFDPAVGHVRALEADARKIEDVVSMSAELEDNDLIVDLHGNSRSRLLTFRQKAPVLRAPGFRMLRSRWVHARWTRPRPTPPALERYARALAPLGLTAPGPPRVTVNAESERWAGEWLTQWTQRAPVAICPAARHATKRWIESYWTEVVDRLEAEGRPVVCFSVESERRALPALARRIEAGPLAKWCVEPLPRMAAVLSRCAAAVSCDSGLMHLAAARGLRVVAMFGSTAPELGFAPAGEGHVVLCRHEPCQPCTLHGRATCPKKHFRCMVEIRPDAVLAALASVIETPSPPNAGD